MRELTDAENKAIMINLMKQIDAVCKENNIRYFLHAGTLLGTIRHKGFIPWDDDIDITMFREDYIKFIEIVTKIDCGFDIICNEKNKDYHYAFGKAVDRGTLLVEQDHKNKVDLGVYIDIFPLDIVPDNFDKAYKFVKKCNTYSHIAYMSFIYSYKSYKVHGIKKKIVKPFVYFIAKLMGTNFWINKLIKLSQKYSDTNSKYIANCLSPNYVKIFEKSWYDETVLLEFEGEKFCAPKEWDKVLTCMYKDYMQLPPKEKQVTHHDFVVYEKV